MSSMGMFITHVPVEWAGQKGGQVQGGIPKESAGIAASLGVTGEMHKKRAGERE